MSNLFSEFAAILKIGVDEAGAKKAEGAVKAVTGGLGQLHENARKAEGALAQLKEMSSKLADVAGEHANKAAGGGFLGLLAGGAAEGAVEDLAGGAVGIIKGAAEKMAELAQEAFKEIREAADATAEYGERISQEAKKQGVGRTLMQQLEYAAKVTGVSVEDLLESGKDISAILKEANEYGTVLNHEQLENSEKYMRSVHRLEQAKLGLQLGVGAAVSEPFAAWYQGFAEWLAGIKGYVALFIGPWVEAGAEMISLFKPFVTLITGVLKVLMVGLAIIGEGAKLWAYQFVVAEETIEKIVGWLWDAEEWANDMTGGLLSMVSPLHWIVGLWKFLKHEFEASMQGRSSWFTALKEQAIALGVAIDDWVITELHALADAIGHIPGFGDVAKGFTDAASGLEAWRAKMKANSPLLISNQAILQSAADKDDALQMSVAPWAKSAGAEPEGGGLWSSLARWAIPAVMGAMGGRTGLALAPAAFSVIVHANSTNPVDIGKAAGEAVWNMIQKHQEQTAQDLASRKTRNDRELAP